ncbi:MAG: hypothetical protein H7A44_08145 [Opitutaceae bacterium]|nr:hypothetical protein [Cephaloticoccus sp.]MCP5530400.1 hypothetical protein [Opitutaceae bacterium]
MQSVLILFWCALVLGSIAWYGGLVLSIGIKAGRDIRAMIDSLKNMPHHGSLHDHDRN